MTIDAAGPITNDDVLGATNCGVLVIKNDVEKLADRYARRRRRQIDLEGITVFGGLLETEGLAATSPPNATLDGSTPGALTDTGPLELETPAVR